MSNNGYSEHALRTLYRSNEAVRTILDFFGKRTRTRNGQVRSIKVELRKGTGYRATTEDLFNALLEMEKTGYIRFDKDKDKEMSYIVWKKSLPEIYAVASDAGEAVPEARISHAETLSHHPFRTLGGRQLNLPYFSDLSIEDAERIGKFYESVALPTAR